MTMQRKHYNAIAAALCSGSIGTGLIYDISDALAADNNKFDRDKFFKKALSGPTMEQRSAKYRTQLKYLERLRGESRL